MWWRYLDFMEYRFYREGDETGIVEAINASFGSFRSWGLTPEKWLGYEEDYAFRRSLALVAEDRGRIVGHLHIVMRRLRFGEACLEVGGIANVTTIPEYRGRGVASSLVGMALEYCRSRGVGLSALFTGYPGTPHRVYWRKGFADTEFTYGFAAEAFQLPVESAGVLEFEEVSRTDVDELASLYEKHSPYGSAWRPREYWLAKILGDKVYGQTFFYRDAERFIRLKALWRGRPVGYVLAARPGENGEAAVLEAMGERRFLRDLYVEVFRRLVEDGAKAVRVSAPRSYGRIIPELVLRSGGIYMVAVPSPAALFKGLLREFSRRLEERGLHERIGVRILSEYGGVELRIDGFEVELGCDKVDAEIRLDRDGFTRMVHGFARFSDVLLAGKAFVNSAISLRRLTKAMDSLFPYREAYIWPVDHW